MFFFSLCLSFCLCNASWCISSIFIKFYLWWKGRRILYLTFTFFNFTFFIICLFRFILISLYCLIPFSFSRYFACACSSFTLCSSNFKKHLSRARAQVDNLPIHQYYMIVSTYRSLKFDLKTLYNWLTFCFFLILSVCF